MKCLNCNENLTRYQVRFCTFKCREEFDYKSNVNKWLLGTLSGFSDSKNHNVKPFVRKYLHERSGGCCEKCGFFGTNPFSKRSILQIHHKDGNSINVTPDNLELLCPNCHAMTNTFMGINRGKSTRIDRYMET